MKHQWEAEQTVEEPLALRLIQEQFPALGAKNARLIGAGWDNTAFLVNGELIFRFPRRAIALPLLDAEWSVLVKLAPRLPIRIPVPEWRGEPSAAFPWPFIGYRMLPGFTACHANLAEEQRVKLAEPIARFLRALHAQAPGEIVQCTIPGDNCSRIDGSILTEKLKINLEELSLLGLLRDRAGLEAMIERLQDYRQPVVRSVVHGDFYVRHLLVNEAHQLVGVIDWGDVHVGDPAIDLAIAHSFLPRSAHEIFIDCYGEISQKTWNLAKLRALYSSTMLVLFGYHSKDADLLREGLRGLSTSDG